jgi:two-component system, sensor histidine kinase and response regulator
MQHSFSSSTSRADRILVVDDSPDNTFLIQTILEEEGYEISTADNGEAALKMVTDSPPDLILLDVMMPGMNGYEVTRKVRQNQHLPFMPILLITADDRPRVAEGLDIGADDFIRKPVEYDELLARVRSLLRLKHSVDERDEIARQREDFVSRLTHDLRTPMVAADRMLTLMQEGAFGDLSADMQEVTGIMQRSNQNLLAMVNNLLEVHRHESGHKTLVFTPVSLAKLLREVVEELTPLATQKGLSVELDVPEPTQPTPLEVKGDALELRRVFMNLLGNAIKFTDKGQIQVRLYPTENLTFHHNSHTPTSAMRVEFQDTGPGIPNEDWADLFERFRQGKHKRSGSGLGLYLSRRIVTLHQGQLQFQPAPNGGSLFSVCLPVTQT